MPAQVDTPLFHLDQHDRLPHQVGESGAAGVGLLNPHLELSAGLSHALLAEGLKQPVEEELRFTLLVAGDVFRCPGDKFGEALLAVFVHDETA
jgi:hypothetical protein